VYGRYQPRTPMETAISRCRFAFWKKSSSSHAISGLMFKCGEHGTIRAPKAIT
jgi:hypothetical protein